jgi:hypothetical protein
MAKRLKAAKKGEAAAEPKTDDFLALAIKRYDAAYEREESNIREAYDDLDFLAGNQWPAEALEARKGRPCLKINRVPQFVRQVTGDIRQMRPSIRCVPVDNRGDKDTAEVLAGMIRYIENRSDAQVAYTSGADSQVSCGVGHWRVIHEYAEETTFNQELRVVTIPDGVSVVWDPDSILPNKEDAKFCFVPVDISPDAYKERYPNAPVTDFIQDREGQENTQNWIGEDFVRVAEYWEKRPEKRTLALLPDGAVDDLTDEDDKEYIAKLMAEGARIEQRDGYCVYRSLITLGHTLEEPVKWPGRYIPIIPVVGEQYRVGRKTVRHGVIRFAKDSQRAYNYMRSTQTEVIALQPKTPFIGTDKNFEGKEQMWQAANTKPFPYLTYNPDAKNGNAPPSRVGPAVSLAGVEEAMMLAAEEMKATTGLYDASLGAKSNETSGRAIMARQREGDVGTFVYIENFSRAIRHTGRVLIDLIPHIYDTERIIRVIGEDGREDLLPINRAELVDGMERTLNDVTLGAYDVVLETGPSYSTKRAEARESMIEFMRSAPDIAPVVLDLVAAAQDWPNSDKFAERVKFMLPPAIRAKEAQEAGEPVPDDIQQASQPNPIDMAKLQGQELANQGKQLDNAKKELEIAGGVVNSMLPQQPQAPQQQPQQSAGSTVSDQELQQFAQNVFGAIEQLQAQINQMAQMMAPPMPQGPQYMPVDEQPGQVPGF